MRKLLILVLVSITAFLGVNLTKVSTYAATTPGVTYVTEGNRVYVHLGSATDSETHLTARNYNLLLNDLPDALIEEGTLNILIDTPQNAISYHLDGYNNGVLTYDAGYTEILDYSFFIGAFSSNEIFSSNGQNVDIEINYGSYTVTHLLIYFEIESSPVTYVTEGNRTYVHFGTYTDAVSHVSDSQMPDLNSQEILFHTPENAISFNVINAETMQQITLEDVKSPIGSEWGLFLDGNYFVLWVFEMDGDNSNYVNLSGLLDGFIFYFEIELPPIAAEYGELKIVGNRSYLVFNDYPIIDVTKLYPTLSILYELALPDNAINLLIADEFGSVLFDWNSNDLPDISGYDNLYITTSSTEFYFDVEGQLPNYPTQIFVSFEEGLFPYSVEGYTKFQIYFELTPFENSVPIITGDTIVVNIDNPLPEATLRAEISAYDDLDGDITADLVYDGGTYETARTAGTLVVGNAYTMIYSVEDSSGNITQATINVEVVDITKPVFGISNTTTEISYTQTLNLESFKANLLATDNYDDSEDLVINILTDNYTANKLVPGSYTVVYRAIDTSTNYRDITITVEVIDNVGPVITGPNNFNVPLSPKTNISVILQQFAASDAVDGIVTSSIEVLSDDYTAATTPGIYSVTIRFSDASGNYTNKTFTVTVIDGIPPVLFITSGLLIGVNQLQSLTVEQIIALLEQQGTITGFTVLSNTYTGNEDTPGTYEMVVEYTQNDIQYQHTLSILVTPSLLLQWTVSFITNGGSNLASIIVNDFGQLLTQAPTRAGYRFVGWYKDAELTQPYSMVTGRITENTTLYAKWVPINAGTPSVIIDNLSNLKLVDIMIIVGTITVGIGIGLALANKKKPIPKRKRG